MRPACCTYVLSRVFIFFRDREKNETPPKRSSITRVSIVSTQLPLSLRCGKRKTFAPANRLSDIDVDEGGGGRQSLFRVYTYRFRRRGLAELPSYSFALTQRSRYCVAAMHRRKEDKTRAAFFSRVSVTVEVGCARTCDPVEKG